MLTLQNAGKAGLAALLGLSMACISSPRVLREPIFDDSSEQSLERKVLQENSLNNSQRPHTNSLQKQEELNLPVDVALVYSCLLEGVEINAQGEAVGEFGYINHLKGDKEKLYIIEAHYSLVGNPWMSVVVGTPPSNYQLCYFDGKNGEFDGIVDRAVQYTPLNQPNNYQLHDLKNPERFSLQYHFILQQSFNVMLQVLQQQENEQKEQDYPKSRMPLKSALYSMR